MNFSALCAALAAWTDRTDLDERIPEFVALAEARLDRDLVAAEREAELIVTASGPNLSIPDDHGGLRTLIAATNPARVLEPMALADLYRNCHPGRRGTPQYYAVQGIEALVLAPAPDRPIDLHLHYYRRIPALSALRPDNWLIEAHPDVYLAASLVEAFAFQMDETRAAMWEGRLQEKMRSLRMASARKSHGGAPRRLKSGISACSTFDIQGGR